MGRLKVQPRANFEEAIKVAPSILIIDELVVTRRGLVASMVTLLDRLHLTHSQVVVVAATNRLDGVDPTLIRQPAHKV